MNRAICLAVAGLVSLASAAVAQQGPAAGANGSDPRVGLRAGLTDAGQAAKNMVHLANLPKPANFVNPESVGDLSFSNSDLAFRGNLAFMGNFYGFNIYDITDPANPVLKTSVVCPGGQGDLSVHGNLLFMSVEETRGRVDCGTQGTSEAMDPERFRGVRIFDISTIENPRQIAAVQTCRGSHTHTLVTNPRDASNLYVYVSGTGVARPGEELAGCSPERSPDDPQTSYWSIAIIQVPLSAPHQARVINEPRIFADHETGAIAGLWGGGDHGPGTQRTSMTNQCHDITAYPAIGLAGGACAGNGILLNISDPANPVRIDEVHDQNFAYWHSATFNNDGTKVIFTDEWGGGTQPRCRAEDAPEWGANAIFDIVDGKLQFASYYKLPAPQTATENCVAHNGSLIPVPGRDIKVQAWYQGGVSVFDFTDSANPIEIAYFDRGPISATQLAAGGFWSAYWYNGHVYGSEMVRGLDVFRLSPSEHLSANEIEAARLVRFDEMNPQEQPRMSWPASFVVARAYVDQLARSGALNAQRVTRLTADLNRAERMRAGAQRRTALERVASQLDADSRPAAGLNAADTARMRALGTTLREIGAAR
ncbi:hypothetical protein BH23GEM6_BH23GEM6_21970 [soil metagenome]